MDIKLKNIDNKKIGYIIYVLIVLFTSVTFLSFLEVKDNLKYLDGRHIYINSELKYQIDSYTNNIIDFVSFYKNEAYVKDKSNITQNDRDICRAEIKDKIELEYDNFRNKQYTYQSFQESTQEQKDKILEEERKNIEEKYTFSEEEFEKYVIDRKLNSYNALKNEIESFNNLKFMAYDRINNAWIGDNSENILTLQSNSKFFVERNMKSGPRKGDKLFINGKEVENYRLKEQILNYNYSSYDKYYNMFSNNNTNISNITLYIWIPSNIIPGDNIYYLLNDVNNNIRRVITISIVFLVSFLVTLLLVKLCKDKNYGNSLIEDVNRKVKKYPIEYKVGVGIIAFIVWRISYNGSYYNTGYTKWLNFSNLIGTGIVLAVIYLVVRVLYLDYKDGILLKNNITTNIWIYMENAAKQGSIFRTIFLYIATYAVIGFGLLFIALLSGGVLFPICFILGIIMTIALFVITVRNMYYLDKIMAGAKDGAEGRLTYKIEERGNGKLKELAHNINNIKDGLRASIQNEVKSEKMKTELITNVSHDLKTPLTSIINYIDLLKREDIKPESARDYVNILDNKSQRLKVLIEDLFEAAKAASGAIELNVERLDITQLLKQALGENDEKLRASNLEVKANIPEEKIFVNGDGRRLYRVFENLITNISKYSMNNTRVYIDVIKEENEIKIIMKNISSYELNFDVEEITERFKRGDEARTSDGSGLGLAIAKSIIELHKGDFNIEIDGDLFKSIIILKI